MHGPESIPDYSILSWPTNFVTELWLDSTERNIAGNEDRQSFLAGMSELGLGDFQDIDDLATLLGALRNFVSGRFWQETWLWRFTLLLRAFTLV